MYRLRMMLQQAQAAGGEVAAEAAGTANKYKRDMSWLMEAHRWVDGCFWCEVAGFGIS